MHRNWDAWSASTVRYPGPNHGVTLASKSFAYNWADPLGSASPCPSNEMVPLDFNSTGVGVLQDWADGDLPVHGLTLRASVTDSFAWKKFQRATNDGAFLSVTHTRYGATYDMVGGFDPWPNNGQFGWAKVRVTNTGADTWTPTNGFRLGHRVINRDTGATFRGWRASAPMPTDVSHGESVTLHAKVEALPPGSYQLRWDMAKDGDGSFSSHGVPMGAVNFGISNVAPILREISPRGNIVEGTLTPALHATGEDIDHWPSSSLQYRFKICGGTPTAPTGCAESPWSVQSTWTMPAGTLEWGERYFWRAWVKDGGGLQNPDVGPFWLTTTVPQPAITSHLAAASATAAMRGFDPQVGDYVTRATDATVAAVGPPLQVDRTYNSRDPRTGAAFGAGWSSPFDMRLVPDADSSGNVVVTLADGQTIRFGRDAGGGYRPPSGRFATLLEATASGWTLTEKRGVTYAFDTGGRLVEITDRHGREQQLTYNPDGTLATATDVTSGRALHFTWAGGHVTSVATDPVGGAPVAWTYTYDGDRLTKVCGPTSTTACTTYGYTTGSHYRTVILDHHPRYYWRLGDASGEAATSDVLANQGNDTAEYVNVALGVGGALPGTPDTAATFNGTSSRVRLPDDVVRRSHNLAVELWFKTTTGGVLFSYQDKGITSDPSTGGFVPALYVGSDGKLRGQMWQGTVGPITSTVTVNDGTWHHAVLSGAGNTQTLYLDGEVVGSLAGSIHHNDMAVGYIGTGFVSRDTGEDWPAGTTPPRSFFNGSIDEVAVYHHPIGLPAVREHFAARAQADLLTTVTLPSGKPHAQVTYDVVLDRVSQLTDANGGTWTVEAPALSGSEVSYKQLVIRRNPWAYWQLSETYPSIAHSLPIDRQATYVGVSPGASGVFPSSDDTAARFNRDAWVELPDGLFTGGNGAVELWFKTTRGGVLFSMQAQDIGDPIVSGQARFVPMLYVGADGKLRGQFWDGGVQPFTSTQRVDDGQWHHTVVVAANAAWQAMYLDGARVGDRNGTIDISGMPKFYVGAGFLTWTWPSQFADPRGRFQGEIDEVAVYRHSLSPTDVAERFDAVDTPLTKEVTAEEPSGHVATDVYDPAHGGRAVRQAIGGLDRGFTYDTGGFLKTVTDAGENKLTLGHDARGNVVSRTTCQTGTACFTSYFDYFLNSADPVDPRNDKLTSERDGRSASASDPTFQTTYEYTAAGDLASATTPATPDDPDGHTTTRTYTDGTEAAIDGGTMPPGLPRSVSTPAGRTTTYAYRANGDLAEVTLPSGLVQRYQYDDLGRMVSQTEVSGSFPAGVTTTYAYDGWSRLSQATGPPVDNAVSQVAHQASTAYAYDDDGNLASQTTSDLLGGDAARVTTYVYDAHNRLTSTTDAEGGVTTATYDVSGDLVGQVDAEGNELAYAYFPDGHKLASVALRGWTGDPNAPSPPADLVLVSYQRDPAGRVAAETDAMGRTRRFEYFDDGNLSQANQEVPLEGGGVRLVPLVTRSYDGAGNVVRESGPDGSDDTAFTYDAATRLTRQVLDPDGLARQASFTYDPDGNVVREELAAAGTSRVEVTEHAYDTAGREVRQTVHHDGGSLLATTFAYDQRGLLTGMTDPRGNVTGADPAAFTTNLGYDEAGRRTTVTLPPVQVESLGAPPATSRPVALTGYDTFGEATHAKDANGNITTVTYDRLGRPTTTTAAAYTPPGGTELVPTSHVTYDRLGRVTQQTDPLGHASTFAYDQLGNLASMTEPAVGDPPGTPGVWRFTYTTVGERLSATDPTGARVESTYDVFGRQVTSTQVERHPTAGNFTTTLGYDDAGNPTSRTTPTEDTWQATFNNLGEPVTATDPSGNVTTTSYDLAGRVRRVELADGSATVNTYDLAGRLVAQTDENTGGTVLRSRQLGYDPAGNPTSATSALGFETTWTFDAANRMVSQVEPVSSTEQIATSFGYDAHGNRTRFTDGRGNATVSTFNTLGLPKQAIEPATDAHPTVADRSYTTVYDAAGQPVTKLLPGGVRRDRVFDQLGRLTSETGTGAEAATATRTLGYDLSGRLVTIGAPGGTTTYSYSDRGLLLGATGPSGNATFAYDAAGRVTSRTDASGTATFGYTSDGLLASATETLTGATRTYSYDTIRQLTEIDFGNGIARTYDYDDLHRLISDALGADDGAGGTQVLAQVGYGYDADDRVTSKTTITGDTDTFTYDHASRLTGWTHDSTTTTYAWDQASNRTSAAGQAATFDERNRQLTDGTAAFTYTPRGTLASRNSGTDTQTFAFDAFDRQVSAAGLTVTYDSLDRAASRDGVAFTYADQSNNLVGDSTATFARDPAGNLLALDGPAGATAVMQDRHSDVIATFNPADGQLAATTRFGPFGTRVEQTGTQPALGFQGGWTDPQTGQVNMHARWYTPTTGTFTTRDSIPLAPTPSANANRYTYALANPLAYTDPGGHFAIALPVIGAAAAVVAIAGLTYLVVEDAIAQAQDRPSHLDRFGEWLWNDVINRDWSFRWPWAQAAPATRAAPRIGYRIGHRTGEISAERGRWWGPSATIGGRPAVGAGPGSGCHGCGISLPGTRTIPRPTSRPRFDPRTIRIPAPPAASLPHINIRPPVDPTRITNLPGTLAATAAATLAASTQAAHLAETPTAAASRPATPPAICAQHPTLQVTNACQPLRPDQLLDEFLDQTLDELRDTAVDIANQSTGQNIPMFPSIGRPRLGPVAMGITGPERAEGLYDLVWHIHELTPHEQERTAISEPSRSVCAQAGRWRP